MKAIIIKRQLSGDEIHNIIELAGSDSHIRLYPSVSLPDELRKYTTANLELNEPLKRKINYDILKKTIDFSEKKYDGRSVAEWFTVERASVWHYHKFRIYFSIRNLYIQAAEINEILKEHNDIVIFSDDRRLEKIISHRPNLKIEFRYTKAKHRIDYLSFLYYILYFIICFVKNIFVPVKNARHAIFKIIIPLRYLDIPTLKPVTGNIVLGYLFKKIDKDFLLINERETPKFTKGNKFRLKQPAEKSHKTPALNSEGLLLKRLLNPALLFKLFKTSRILKLTYDRLIDDAGSDIEHFFLGFIKNYHFTTLYFLLKYYSYKSFFKSHNIKTICSIDENSPETKSVFDAAKSESVTTVGIQHGAIHELHPAYMYSKYDSKKRIMADYTLVWGEYYKSLLSHKGNYNADSIIVTGHIRTDVIPLLEKGGPRIKGLPDDLPIVIFASQPQRDASLRIRTAMDVFNAAKKLHNIMLIVKLHPAEKNDSRFYESVADESGLKNYKIIYNEDLYTLISSCKALITCFSTVGTETAYFYKPLIILDHLKQDIQGYKKEGIAFQATGPEELYHYLKGILDGSLVIDRKAYSRFISKYAYKIDGLVSERCVAFIKSLV
jgi:CDP-glycerol glycerophosphotransferase (TagB/SpsB family)